FPSRRRVLQKRLESPFRRFYLDRHPTSRTRTFKPRLGRPVPPLETWRNLPEICQVSSQRTPRSPFTMKLKRRESSGMVVTSVQPKPAPNDTNGRVLVVQGK